MQTKFTDLQRLCKLSANPVNGLRFSECLFLTYICIIIHYLYSINIHTEGEGLKEDLCI